MKSVTRFEASLLRILRAFLGRVPMEQAMPLLAREQPRPRCLSRACVELIQDSLAKGVVTQVAREGWRRERFLRAGQAKAGRLWERTSPEELGLTFSRNTLELLLWMTAENVVEMRKDGRRFWSVGDEGAKSTLTLGDRLLFVLASQALADAEIDTVSMWKVLPHAEDGLFALVTPGEFQTPRDTWRPDFSPWLTLPGSCILEAWQTRLSRVWLEAEQNKRRIAAPEQLEWLGQRQDRILTAFLDACDKAGRRDLARFLLQVVRQLTAEPQLSLHYFGQLNTAGLRMADRAATYDAGLAVLRQFERLSAWQLEARGVAHYDEQYGASQLWKSDWEAFEGDDVALQARRTIAALNPLST